MREQEKLAFESFIGGVTEAADLEEGQFSDSLNLVPDSNKSRLTLRGGVACIWMVCSTEVPVQIVGVRDSTCTAIRDEIILASCSKLTHVYVPLDVNCVLCSGATHWEQHISGNIQTGGGCICHLVMVLTDELAGIAEHYTGCVYRCYNLGAPPYAFAQSSDAMFIMGQGPNAYLAYACYQCTGCHLYPAVDKSGEESCVGVSVAFNFRCAHCWANSGWYNDVCTLRKNLLGCYCGKTPYCTEAYKNVCWYWVYNKPCISCWECYACFLSWYYNRTGTPPRGTWKRRQWNFHDGCYRRGTWAGGYAPTTTPCYLQCSCHVPYANVLTYHKGRVFAGMYKKKNGTFTEIVYHSVDDTRCHPRYMYWRPLDNAMIGAADGNQLTVATSPSSYLTGMVGVENGLLLFFTDRIMMWQWPDASSPHDVEGGARIETIYTGVGAIHHRAIQTYLSDIYFLGRAPDGFVRVMKLDESLSLSQESTAIDKRINCFDFRPTSNCIDTAMFRDSFFLRLGASIYLYDMKRKAWYPLKFNYVCYNNPLISMAASKVTDRLYISVFDCFSSVDFYNKIVVFPYGLTDCGMKGTAAICWKLEFDNLNFGSGSNEKYIRDVVLEIDNEHNEHPVCVTLINAQTGTQCAKVSKSPTKQRGEIEKFELGKRLKNAKVVVSGSFEADAAGVACHSDAVSGTLGINSVAIRFRPRSSVED
jgi:hypothetical protein